MYKRSVRLLLAALGASVWVAACDDVNSGRDEEIRPPNGTTPGELRPTDPANNQDAARDANDPTAKPPDNTTHNRGDQDGAAKTPFSQSEDPEDIRITADIRRSVLAADNLSTNADNVKIMTSGGVVTLRGVVDSAAEKEAIEALATAAPGVQRVDSQLEVDTN